MDVWNIVVCLNLSVCVTFVPSLPFSCFLSHLCNCSCLVLCCVVLCCALALSCCVASAHVLYSLGLVAPSSPLTFYSHLSGLLSATCSIDATVANGNTNPTIIPISTELNLTPTKAHQPCIQHSCHAHVVFITCTSSIINRGVHDVFM